MLLVVISHVTSSAPSNDQSFITPLRLCLMQRKPLLSELLFAESSSVVSAFSSGRPWLTYLCPSREHHKPSQSLQAFQAWSKTPGIPASGLLFGCSSFRVCFLLLIEAVFKEKTRETESPSPLPEYSHHPSPGEVLMGGRCGSGPRALLERGSSWTVSTQALETCS